MKIYKSLLIVLGLISCCKAMTQNEFQRKDLNNDYSWNNSSRNERLQYYFGLDSLELSTSEYHFRYIKSSQIIDLYSENGMDFNGQIINYLQENKIIKTDLGKDTRPHNYLYEKKEIENAVASKAGRIILNQKSYSIPTDSSIKNWNFGWMDCGAISFIYKVETKYYQQSYTCAENQQDSIDFVPEVKRITDTLSQILGLKESLDSFINILPKGKRYAIDGWITMYTMTEKEIVGWRKGKPIRDYKKSIKDTIDKYLEFKLNELIPNSPDLDCYDNYTLFFSKNGKLKRMKVDLGLWERLSDKGYRKCKRILEDAFREIRIDFVDPKYKFQRELSFGQKGVYIYDRMVY